MGVTIALPRIWPERFPFGGRIAVAGGDVICVNNLCKLRFTSYALPNALSMKALDAPGSERRAAALGSRRPARGARVRTSSHAPGV